VGAKQKFRDPVRWTLRLERDEAEMLDQVVRLVGIRSRNDAVRLLAYLAGFFTLADGPQVMSDFYEEVLSPNGDGAKEE